MTPHLLADVGATCLDAAAPPLAIDVVALSVGLPDGVYYAGKKLTEWMSFEDERVLNDLSGRNRRRLDAWQFGLCGEPDPRAKIARLEERRRGESLVVRWCIENGLPSTPKALTFGDSGLSSGVPRDESKDAFRWGSARDASSLGVLLLEDVFRTEGYVHRYRTSGHQRSTNDYLDFYVAVIGRLKDTWVIPQIDVIRYVYERDLKRARNEHHQAWLNARHVGVKVEDDEAITRDFWDEVRAAEARKAASEES